MTNYMFYVETFTVQQPKKETKIHQTWAFGMIPETAQNQNFDSQQFIYYLH